MSTDRDMSWRFWEHVPYVYPNKEYYLLWHRVSFLLCLDVFHYWVFAVETVYCLCLDEMYIILVFEILSVMQFALHQERTFWRSVVRDWTTFSTYLCDGLRVVSSANISAHVLVSDKGRLFIYIKKVWAQVHNRVTHQQ